jgi:hypothetical protein
MRQLWRAGRAQASGLGAARKYINETLTKPTAAPSMYREQATVITIVIIGLQYRYVVSNSSLACNAAGRCGARRD